MIDPAATRNAPPLPYLLAAALPLVLCGGLLLYGAGRGLDLTDEIFYLVWTRDPHAYSMIYQPFGYLLHPLYALVGGDLQAYRLIGFALAAAAGATLGLALAEREQDRLAFALYGAGAALTIFFPWIVTPSYNSAANVGAMLIVVSLVDVFSGRSARRLPAIVAGGAGLCLAAFAKPPLFAIGVAALVGAAILPRRARISIAPLAAIAVGIAFASLFLAPWEVPGLVRRMIATQRILGLPNTPLGLPLKLMRDWAAVPPWLSAAAVAAALSFALRRTRWFVWPGYAAVALCLCYIPQAAEDVGDGDIPDYLGLALVLIAAGYAGVLRLAKGERLVATTLLLATPFAVALGTFNNQWAQTNFSMPFPLFALFALAAADPAKWRRGTARALCVVAPPAVMLLAAFIPYSLPESIFAQHTAIHPPLARGTIRVDAETADFVTGAHGMAHGALLIDLSGTGPGVAASVGAHVPVLAWLNPAVANWVDVAWSRLTPPEQARAWFVTPLWPGFDGTAAARWLAAHKAAYCQTALPPMTFWKEERALVLWRPCTATLSPQARSG